MSPSSPLWRPASAMWFWSIPFPSQTHCPSRRQGGEGLYLNCILAFINFKACGWGKNSSKTWPSPSTSLLSARSKHAAPGHVAGSLPGSVQNPLPVMNQGPNPLLIHLHVPYSKNYLRKSRLKSILRLEQTSTPAPPGHQRTLRCIHSPWTRCWGEPGPQPVLGTARRVKQKNKIPSFWCHFRGVRVGP